MLNQTVTGCTFTTSSTTITCTGGGFTSGDVGASITGTDIPPGATISTYTSATAVKISVDPSGAETGTGVTLTIAATNAGTDYVFFSVNDGTKTGCTAGATDGCILSYTVNGTVAQAGTGLNVTTPGTNGCWATGGLVIDNSATAPTGASQLYFVNLDGNAAGSSSGKTSSNCTSGSSAVIDATQASQASPNN